MVVIDTDNKKTVEISQVLNGQSDSRKILCLKETIYPLLDNDAFV